MQQIWKFLPILVGLFLGWMIFHPPDMLEALGPLKYLVMLALVFVLLVAFIAWNINASLPETVTITPEPGAQISPEGQGMARELESLGFTRIAEAPWRIGIAPPAILVPYIHDGDRMYATVFQTGTLPPKTSCDLVSVFQGFSGGLTTSREPGGGAMPAPSGSLRQIFPGKAPRTLFENHRAAVDFLRARRIECRAIKASDFERDFRASFSRLRGTYLKNPLVFTLITLWRAATQKTPHLGALQAQAIAEKQLQEITSGRTSF